MSSPATILRQCARIRRSEVEAAVWGPEVGPRSDYDLNPDAPRPPSTHPLRSAAVLCPLVERPDGYSVILTRRSAHLAKHAGQIAFPGGKVDPGDRSPLAAALREADEEIGMLADQIDVVGPIDLYRTRTGFSVTPFVAFVDPRFEPIPDPNEVAEVFEAPLDFLMDPRNHQRLSREVGGVERFFYAMPFRDYFIWGATAGMLRALSDRLSAQRRDDGG